MKSVKELKKLLGDRILVKRLEQPAAKRGLFVPESYRTDKRGRNKVWWGEVVLIGHKSYAAQDFELAKGDIVGCDPMGADCETFTADEGTFTWVADEFVNCKDEGTIREVYENGERLAAQAGALA